ncbi:hypothetical protein L873DRAFT_159407 [Choiromyces venosus 120613-1]|uniref:Uncharacterized protein n=1 Tax=Choiromyces venosus 120613-1 TaxID=1336337 RepID=A0A3N4JFL1_9PEZI|nr:hypothetical protein L873DRAFT_159407 [Choiromyces venosus 120613-1]
MSPTHHLTRQVTSNPQNLQQKLILPVSPSSSGNLLLCNSTYPHRGTNRHQLHILSSSSSSHLLSPICPNTTTTTSATNPPFSTHSAGTQPVQWQPPMGHHGYLVRRLCTWDNMRRAGLGPKCHSAARMCYCTAGGHLPYGDYGGIPGAGLCGVVFIFLSPAGGGRIS